jgi:hypothetical protein
LKALLHYKKENKIFCCIPVSHQKHFNVYCRFPLLLKAKIIEDIKNKHNLMFGKKISLALRSEAE